MENKRRIVLIILGIIILVLIVSVVLFNIKDNSGEFKKEYESYNDSYTKVSIIYDNKFVYKKESDFEGLLKEAAIIYLGNAKSNECRNAVNVLQHINASTIYYLDTNEINNYDYIIKLIDSNLMYGDSYKDIPIVVGVKEGIIVSYHIGTLDGVKNQELNKEEQEELKKIYDNINTMVYDDTCGIENPEGC